MTDDTAWERAWTYGWLRRGLLTFVAALMLVLPLMLLGAALTAEIGAALLLLAFALPLLALTAFLATIAAAAWRTRVALVGGDLMLRVPAWRGGFPFPRYTHRRIPLTEIASVEVREELARSLGLSTVTKVASVVTRAGERTVIATAAGGELDALPVGAMAGAIAAAAGRRVTDRGMVEAGPSLATLLGRAGPAWDAPTIAPDQARRERSRALQILQLVSALTAMLLLLRACLD
jgi:hypothetical protein